MRRNLVADISKRFPGYYRQDKIQEVQKRLGLNGAELASLAGINKETIRDVLAGRATSKSVWPVAKALGLDWSALHSFDDIHLAGRNGDSKKAR